MRDIMTLVLCAALAFGIYLYFKGDDIFKSGSAKKIVSAVTTPKVEIGGAKFKLTNQFGEIVTERSFLNSKSLVFFGFTNCPDVCPTTLAVMTEAYIQLGENLDDIKPIFITIDPARDNPQVIQEYLLNFHKDIIGLTGDKTAIEKLTKSYKAYASKDAKGEVMHTDLIYLMDENGKYIHHFNRNDTPQSIVKYIKKL
jgi:protein SCO1/2